jgi:L-alanine-DL-glutamate epimerase-like enolase superfamily enzyme
VAFCRHYRPPPSARLRRSGSASTPHTIIGDTACCHIATTTRFAYPVDCEGHVSFLRLGESNPFTGGIRIESGRAILPDAPGLGVDADWADLERRQQPLRSG